MEDSPAKYDRTNQRPVNNTQEQDTIDFDDEGQHYAPIASENESAVRKDKKVKKPKKKITTVEVLQPTQRDKQTAGAYGG